jgi:acetyltransferase
MVELMRDSAVALPPLTEVLADRLIGRTRAARMLGPLPGRPAADMAAVRDVVLRVSELVTRLPQVAALDVNPLLAGPEGVLAVDARIEIGRPPAMQGPGGHLAIAPYPRERERRTTLADGTPLTIRPIRPEDAESEVAFMDRLSDESRRMRFMSMVRSLSPTDLARFTQIDYAREMALVALVPEGAGERQVGVARYGLEPDGRTVEFAVVVADALRGHGLGTRLMTELMDAARDHGATRIVGDVLAENRDMLRLMDDLGFAARTDPDDRTVKRVERLL